MIPPTRFIPLAEEMGLINEIGLWVLRESCGRVKEWQKRYPTEPALGLCVNISAKQLHQSDLAEKIAGVLSETGLDPRCLTLEISERVVMEDAEYTIGKLEELKNLNVKLAIDDFGTGYCSLAYLERFPLDVLKIDRLFVNRDEDDPEGEVIMSAVLEIAHSLGLVVTAEGVETPSQADRLRKIGCDMAQGYHFARPLPPATAVGELVVG